MLAPNDLVPESYGISSARMRLRRRISAGSRPRRRGALVHQPLADEVALGPPGRPERARRRLVGDDRPEIAVVVGHAIRAGQERGAELGRARARRCARTRRCPRGSARAARRCGPRASKPISASYSTSRAWLVDMQALAALLDPPHGAAELHRGERDQHVLGIQLAAHAEAAAHVHLGQAQRADGDAEDRRQDGAVDVDALGGADQVQLAAARIGRDRRRGRASRAPPRSGADR